MEDEDDECEVIHVVAGQRQEAAVNAQAPTPVAATSPTPSPTATAAAGGGRKGYFEKSLEEMDIDDLFDNESAWIEIDNYAW